MTERLTGKIAIITGAAAGIGRASCLLFAQQSAVVVAVDHDATANQATVDLVRKANGIALGLQADVSSADQVKNVVDRTLNEYDHIDILFNNAGIVTGGKMHTLEERQWDRIFNVNVKSIFLFSRAVVPHMLLQGGGTILNTASSTALRVAPDRALYNATKGAVIALTRSMALDYASDNIRVNCLCPGTTDTPSLRERLSAMGNYEELRSKFIARQPLQRLGTSDEIAQAALYLVSDDAAFVTGAAFQIDGGMSL